MAGPRKRSRELLIAKALNDAEASATEASQLEADNALKSDIDNILTALQQVRQKTITDGQKRSEELLNSTAAEIKSLIDQAKKKTEAEREVLSKQTEKLCKEYETALKDEAAKYKTAYATFCDAKDSHLQAYEDIFTKFENCKQQILCKFDNLKKKEKAAYNDLFETCTQKLNEAEQSIKKLKQDDNSYQMLRKSLGTILKDSSDDEADI